MPAVGARVQVVNGYAMNQADINRQMLPWGDKEISRFLYRAGLFQRRGWLESKAEFMADRLALRDQERDDRRICLECQHIQRSGGCFIAAQGRMPNASKRMQPVTDLLQRCESFEWQKP